MAIARVESRGNWFYVYDEKGYQTCTIPATGKTLVNFTSSSFTIRDTNHSYTYDEKGRQISTGLAY